MKFRLVIRALALLVVVAFGYSAHAFYIRPMDGLWSIDNELSLSVGRAMNLELGGGTLVVTMYNYNSLGQPTFYVGGGALTANNTAVVTLSEPKGGTCLGCPLTSGSLLSTPGTATFQFTSSTTGFVTLPKEGRVAITKGLVTRIAARDGLRGAWAFTYVLNSTSAIAETPA